MNVCNECMHVGTTDVCICKHACMYVYMYACITRKRIDRTKIKRTKTYPLP